MARLLRMQVAALPRPSELAQDTIYSEALLIAARAALGDASARDALSRLPIVAYELAVHACVLAATQLEGGAELIRVWLAEPGAPMDRGYLLGGIEAATR
jgi:hypothetical protein